MQILFDGVAKVIDSIGGDNFLGRLAQFLQSNSSYDSLVIWAYFEDKPPEQLFSNLTGSDAERTLAPYSEYAYILDPMFLMYREGVEDGVYRLADCVPDGFTSSEYYRSYYSLTGLKDECSIYIWMDGGSCLSLSLGRRSKAVGRASHDLQFLNAVFGCTASLCRLHWPSIKPSKIKERNQFSAHLNNAVQNFGQNILSKRECQTVHLILRGHSSKSIARVLKISPETVKVHRRRIYTKLNIGSQGELFLLFLSAISVPPIRGMIDH